MTAPTKETVMQMEVHALAAVTILARTARRAVRRLARGAALDLTGRDAELLRFIAAASKRLRQGPS